jgi:isopenicillin-N epimerase
VISHYFEQGFEREFSWQGTRDRAAWLAIPKALGFITDLGWDRVMSHNHAMAVWVNQMLCERWNVPSISPLDGHLLGSMATVPLPAPLDRLDAAATAPIQQQLYSEFKIEVPIMPWSNRSFIRPCCQVYNTPADYERLADIISTICSQQRIQ